MSTLQSIAAVSAGAVSGVVAVLAFESPMRVLAAGTAYALVFRHFAGAEFGLGIGPYHSVYNNRLSLPRWAQRTLMNMTRRDISINWFPLNILGDVQPKRASDNGHPVSGAVRDAARRLITGAVDAIGATKLELSPASQSNAEAAIHEHFAVSDLHRGRAFDRPNDKSVIVGIDVDYYVINMKEIAGYCRPMIFHTFNPTAVSGRDGDSHYTIRDDIIEYRVSGGAEWKHPVWNWCAYGEFFFAPVVNTAIEKMLTCFGITKYVFHKIHHSRPWTDCPHRVLVWTIPQYTAYRFDWLRCDMHARALEYMRFSDGAKPGWNRINSVNSDSQHVTNFGRVGEDANASLPVEHFDVLMGMASNQSVTTRMIHLGYTDPIIMSLVSQYYGGKLVDRQSVEEVGRPCGVKVHWPMSADVDKPEISSRAYARALVTDENMMPMIKRWESMSRTIDVRVTYVANNVVPSAKYQNYAAEFIRFVVPQPGVGVPLDLEETVALLDKPSQKLAIAAVWETLDARVKRMIECFMKNEATNKNGRAISSFNDARFLLLFSSYTLAFRDNVLHAEHNSHWFCPGHTPTKLAEKVCTYVSEIGEPLEGDFSNFDGTVPAWAHRVVMNAVYHRWFAGRYQKELTGYTDMLINCPARSKSFGFKYDAGVGVKSGSPTTCDLNTVLNAFMQYCAVRGTNALLTPLECFRSIGLAFGDDSLFDRQYGRAFAKTAVDLGMKLKLERYDERIGVCFLARVFPDPLNTMTSFQDPLRTWRKLHLTARDPNVPIESAALDRVAGYLITDPFTPITSAYCRMVQRYYRANAVETDAKRASRKSYLVERPYWATTETWPQAVEDSELMLKCISARVGITVEQLRGVQTCLENCTDPWADDFVINRDHEPCPYEDTVLPDGTPSAAVDPRIVLQQREVHHKRAKPTPRQNPSESSSDSGVASGTNRQMRRRDRRNRAATSAPAK